MNLRFPIALALGAALAAQNTVTVPPGAATAEQASTTAVTPVTGFSPISGAGSPGRSQYVYDSSNFTNQGINTPMVITKMRLRANGSAQTWSGGTVNQLRVDMSTSAVDYLATTSTFDSNHSGDRTTVYNTACTIQPGTANAATAGATPGGPFCCDIDFAALGTPFAYHPALGDLCIDFMSAGFVGSTTGVIPQWDTQTTGALSRRSFTNIGQFEVSGTTPAVNGLVIEFTYLPVTGLYGGFTASVRSGTSPLAVQFTDVSASGVGPITSWAWDFENDGVWDDFTQNPLHTFSCGTYSVKMRVSDGTNTIFVLRNNLIVVDAVTANFTSSSPSNGTVAFTDTTTPAATSWAWDFNGDNVIDSTVQNPVWNFGGHGVRSVTLTAGRNCGPTNSVTKRVVSSPDLTTQFTGGSVGSSNWMALFDLAINNPRGVEIVGMDVLAGSTGVAMAYDIYVTPGTCVGKEATNTAWRRVAQGSGTSAGSNANTRTYITLTRGIYLPAGTYGIAIHNTAGGWNYSSSGTNPANIDMAISNPRVKAGLFTGTLFTPRYWNGSLYYAVNNTSDESSYGFFDFGCTGALGIPSNVNVNDPAIGSTLSVNVGGLPNDAGFMVFGFSRTASSAGALPLDLASFGAPGCLARVSPDLSTLILGSGGTANWTFPIPNQAVYLATQFYTQAYSLDTAANALGVTVSDACAGIIGR